MSEKGPHVRITNDRAEAWGTVIRLDGWEVRRVQRAELVVDATGELKLHLVILPESIEVDMAEVEVELMADEEE